MKRILLLVPALLLATACSEETTTNSLRTNALTQRLESKRCTEYEALPADTKFIGGMTFGEAEHAFTYLDKEGYVRQLGCKSRAVYNANTLLLFVGENDQMWKCTVDEEFYRHFYTGLTADIPVERCREVKP